jgi:ATP-dependent RNA helicase MSS116, mitochondrial
MGRPRGGGARGGRRPAAGASPYSRQQTRNSRPSASQTTESRSSTPSITTPPDTPRFEDLREKNMINPTILDTLTLDLKFDHMMPVQAASLEYLHQGGDCLAQAKTGTGKTLAFLLPAISTMLARKERGLSTLILTPTRELAIQIVAEAEKVLKRFPQYKVALAIGGTNKTNEANKLAQSCNILVATPGRLIDHLKDGPLADQLQSLQTLVLDEADRMLDIGFLPALKQILTFLPKKPRQTMLFSATIDQQVHKVGHLFLRPDHQFISTIPEGQANTHESVDQFLITTPDMGSLAPELVSIVTAERNSAIESSAFKAIIFAPTAAQANFYGHILSESGLPDLHVLHSRLSQSRRTNISQDFRTATNAICVATDVIARGMDFPGVTHVFQVGRPADKETYIHRLGRTARAGASGKGFILLGEAESLFTNALTKFNLRSYPNPVTMDVQTIAPALDSLTEEAKRKTYQAWLGFYKTHTNAMKWDMKQLVREANKFATIGMRCAEVPGLEKKTIGKMGLKGVPGLVILSNAPGTNDPGRCGGGEGRTGFTSGTRAQNAIESPKRQREDADDRKGLYSGKPPRRPRKARAPDPFT